MGAARHSNGNGNLKPWPKGVSGNPAGPKPKAITVAKVWREIAEAVDEEDKQKRKRIEVLGHALYRSAKEGNVPAGKLFLDRAYGTALLEELPEQEGAETQSALFIMYLRSKGKDALPGFVEFLK